MSDGKEKYYIVMCSGGRTSMFLAKYIKENPKYKNVLFVFLNTGKERKETINFVHKCDNEWGLGIIWLEAYIKQEKGSGTRYKIVSYKTYSKNGEPFESMLEKYPLPNNMASNCTRELKQRPIEAYIRENLYEYDVYRIIGIRSDEEHRKSNNAVKDKLISEVIQVSEQPLLNMSHQFIYQQVLPNQFSVNCQNGNISQP